METIFRKVSVKERTPKNSGWYFVGHTGFSSSLKFDSAEKCFYFGVERKRIDWWLEEVELKDIVEDLVEKNEDLLADIRVLCNDRITYMADRILLKDKYDKLFGLNLKH